MTRDNTEVTNDKNECCTTSNCCGVEKTTVAKFLRHIAKFFD
jgi:hypothetical protein